MGGGRGRRVGGAKQEKKIINANTEPIMERKKYPTLILRCAVGLRTVEDDLDGLREDHSTHAGSENSNTHLSRHYDKI